MYYGGETEPGMRGMDLETPDVQNLGARRLLRGAAAGGGWRTPSSCPDLGEPLDVELVKRMAHGVDAVRE